MFTQLEKGPNEIRYNSTRLHGFTTQKTETFIVTLSEPHNHPLILSPQ